MQNIEKNDNTAACRNTLIQEEHGNSTLDTKLRNKYKNNSHWKHAEMIYSNDKILTLKI